MEEIADEETRYYPLLRQLCIMERCGICLTQRGEVYSSTPPTPTGTTEMDLRLAALLRAQSLTSSALFNPLQWSIKLRRSFIIIGCRQLLIRTLHPMTTTNISTIPHFTRLVPNTLQTT